MIKGIIMTMTVIMTTEIFLMPLNNLLCNIRKNYEANLAYPINITRTFLFYFNAINYCKVRNIIRLVIK